VKNFVLIGAGGYIAPRHMKAIKETGNNLLAAIDKHDSVGVLDNYFPEADFFTEFERFDRHCEKLRRNGTPVDYVTVCSPNHLHDAHVRFGLRIGADVICEKPVVLNPWNVDALMEMEKETGRQVYNILQLRLHPALVALREKVLNAGPGKKYKVDLKYITARGHWYHTSWKGDVYKSGGITTNIGVHFFDLLIWIFGEVQENIVHDINATAASGKLHFESAEVNWWLSIDADNLPAESQKNGKRTFRMLTVNDELIDLSEDFHELHTKVYKEILEGKGFGLNEVKSTIKLVHQIRNSK
jgi:UDP-N-acetyl-2-amino-2-deoxyglucuronate dehydrogenase